MNKNGRVSQASHLLLGILLKEVDLVEVMMI